MFSRLVFGSEPPMADSDHLVGAVVITVAVMAMAEVARRLRFINVAFGLWLIALAAPGAGIFAAAHSGLAGLVLVALSVPHGKRSEEHYGGWDRYIL
ncbi:hypothetical protein GOC57_28595 [Sinorhizobium meliloti]|uniref:hypothetical protein n=1 Tax=Rhizobium meliloti TaxID=382 RepID=UPI001296BAE7|nr:hypothetical protein [Sinorhizobium meliloti]MDW9377850.1 hypothetical protein [Sinorhizobium meliloti]MDW9496312.1 hypothetical protein [Sinorhizobium meliloti]MDW9565059.1 hypothetical protein [Sinorhizobium meliloti]MDW9652200.1 hypothetical protein [Sinorhizobium meliloti]MDW9862346.1 hypothetical protein [Sinorhizobium meliloti]